MDLQRETPSRHSSILQRNCANDSSRPNWFSTGRNSCYPSKFQKLSPHNKNRIGKPPSLLRLSSTGDSVVEDTTEFRPFEFDPSISNLQGSESNCHRAPRVGGQSTTCSNSKSASTGIFDWFTKFSFSTGNTRQSTAMSLTRECSGQLWDRQNQAELGALVTKFGGLQEEVHMERPGQNMYGTRPCQGAMNGFVQEGIYHPYARNATQFPVRSQAIITQPFRFLNIGQSCYSHRYHQHPYMARNHFMPSQTTTVSSRPFQCGLLPDPSAASANPPRPHAMDRRIAHSQIKRGPQNWCNQLDPRIRSHLIGPVETSQSVASSKQHHGTVYSPKKNQLMGQSTCSRSPMMKNRTDMTHPSKNVNKAATCSHQGSSHQVHRSPPWAKNTTAKQNQSPLKSVKQHPEFSLKTNPFKEPVDQNTESCEKCPNVKDFEESHNSVNSATSDLKLHEDTQNSEICDTGQTDHGHDGSEKPIMHQQSDVASSVSSSVCIRHRETDHAATAEPDPQISTRPESEDMETTCGTSVTLDSARQSVSNSPASLERRVSLDEELAQNASESKSSCQALCTHICRSNGGASESIQKHVEDGSDFGCPENHSQAAFHPQTSTDSPSTKPESESAHSLDLKPLHSSLAFLLSETASNESDFSDSDWDSAGTSPSSDSWDYPKFWDDPYNPLYGWKCTKCTDRQQDDKEQDTGASKLNSSFGDDEVDSGISSLQTQQDETDVVRNDDSDSWDEEEYNEDESSGQLCQLWKSFCPTDDPFNPLNGWMCNSSIKSVHNTTAEDAATACKNPKERPESHDLKPRENATVKPGTNLSPQESIADSTKLHPSVLFILGISQSESSSDDEDDCEELAEDQPDEVWDSFQTTSDPYSPLQGSRLHPSCISEKLPAVNHVSLDNYTATDGGGIGNASPDQIRRRKSDLFEAHSLPVCKPFLKRASSTGCLWIPSGSHGSGRPFLKKKVHFCEMSPTVISFEVPTWSSEYCASRKGPWQEMARDRCRFMDRIRTTETQIAHVLTPQHRLKVQQRLGLKGAGV